MQTLFDGNWDISHIAEEVDRLQLLDEGPSGYRLRRIILTNYWLYETQVFEIPHGRLFLAGANASGKSTVLTAALPLLLEGYLGADRFDTFGKQSRHIEYYILGNETSAAAFTIAEDKRTAYLALEFEWCDPNRPPIAPMLHRIWENGTRPFLTIGMSITGNKKATSGAISAYRFLITDGSRLLYDIPFPRANFTSNQFREALKTHGIICSKQEEYKEYVARYLFGMREAGAFHKLINLLLALRQPNLSSRLTLQDVHAYLANSLPTIPGDATRQAVETVNTMEELTIYIDNLIDAQQEAQALEDTQQALIFAEARLAFDTYRICLHGHRSLEKHFQAFKSRLQLETEQFAETKQTFQSLEQEKQQTLGAIQAIEQNEGIKLANQLVQVEQRVRTLKEQVTQQKRSVESVEHTVLLYSEKYTKQLETLQSDIQSNKNQLKNLWDMAEKQVYWQEAASQIHQSLKQIEGLPSQNPPTQQIIQQIEQSLNIDATAHLRWLRTLETLHLQKNGLTREVEIAATHEKEKLSDVEGQWKHFRNSKRRFETALEQVNKTLEQIVTASSEQTYHETILAEVSTQLESEADPEENSNSLSGGSSHREDMNKRLDASKRDLEATLGIITRANAQIRRTIEELQPEIAEKSIRYKDLQQKYERKQSEQEHLPAHPLRRTIARNHLSTHNIQALPLYLLIDFPSDLASEEAGRIEYMLEDAGILDALIILEQDCSQADALLLTENISDYRIDIANLPEVHPGTETMLQNLCFDKAASDLTADTSTAWEALVTRILFALEQTLLGEKNPNSIHPTGYWKHGLLTGQSGSGNAQFIGRSTRLQIKKRELEALQTRITAFAQDLEIQSQNMDQCKKRQDHLQQLLAQLQTLGTTSNLDATYSEALASANVLEQTQHHLREARQVTHQKRQQRTQLLIALEEACQLHPPLAQNAEMVSIALQSTARLADRLPYICQDLRKIGLLDQEIQSTANLLEQANVERESNTTLFHQLQMQRFQEESTLNELQYIAKQEGVDDLSQRLQQLRQKSSALDGQIQEFANKLAVLEDHRRTQPEELAKLSEQHRKSQLDLQKKHEYCLELLTTVSISEEAFQRFEKGDESLISQLLQTPEQDQDTQANSGDLEIQFQQAWSDLQEKFRACITSLHNYEPELDYQTKRVTFQRENDATPAQLLRIIEKNLNLQQDLLQQEEKQLFEQFLLEDMADLLHTHIMQASDWIREINASLATMPFIGDRYELEWQAKTSFDKLASPFGHALAQQLPLLSKKVHNLSESQRVKLKNAFLQEIRNIRDVPQNISSLNIAQRLQAVFDYRQWFQFKIYTISQAGQRQHLTHKLLASRSGAEQLFALYVPLLAALTALYNSAEPGAPRLLGLDEAFDKASLNNMQQMISFLAKQGFQWIMTGPQLNISGAEVPVIVRYHMLREKEVATAIPQIWQGRRSKYQTPPLADSK